MRKSTQISASFTLKYLVSRRSLLKLLIQASLAVCIATPSVAAFADVKIRFVESAPKDRFVVTNTGNCELQDVVLKVDLTDTRGQLIFDTTESGAGVEVFQPFEQREGDVVLISSASVSDGDKSLSVRIASLPANEQVSFTIDVDDTLSNSELGQIRVTGAEIENGRVTLIGSRDESFTAVFDLSSEAAISGALCPI